MRIKYYKVYILMLITTFVLAALPVCANTENNGAGNPGNNGAVSSLNPGNNGTMGPLTAENPGTAGTENENTLNPVNNGTVRENLAHNPGFEDYDSSGPFSWIYWSWENKGTAGIDNTTYRSGSASAYIENNVETDTRYMQKIKVKPNTIYRLSCWVKTEGIGDTGKGANISIENLSVTSKDLKGTNDWTYLELYGITAENQDSFTLTVGVGGYSATNTGKAWFDDIRVDELDKAPDGVKIENLYSNKTLPPSADAPDSGLSPVLIAFIIFSFLLLAFSVYFFLIRNKSSSYEVSGHVSARKPDRKDYIIMAVMTVVYLLIAVPNLGSFKAPQTYWTPSESYESITLDFGREITLSRVYYFGGVDENRPISGKYRILGAPDGAVPGTPGKFTHLATINKLEREIYTWRYISLPDVKIRYARVLADIPGGTMNEIAFFEKDSKEPVTGYKIIDVDVAGSTGSGGISGTHGTPENLFDESDTVDYKRTYLSGMIFDEIYHARTAFEHLHSMPVYEWTHPPLGKILISLGIAVFGMVPFGWRIVGTLFGAAMIPLLYLFGIKLFNKRIYGFMSAFLLMFDFMHFGLTRIATIDVYGTFFVIVMYYYMFDYFTNNSYELGFRPSLRPLFLSGLFFGIGAACKWICIYAGGGLALLYFLSRYLEYRSFNRIVKLSSANADNATENTSLMRRFFNTYILKTSICCVLFFVIIPAIIYALSYIPYFLVPGSGNDTGLIWRYQKAIFKYHSYDVLDATHPFSSQWWEWPLMRRPLLTYSGSELPPDTSSTMTIMGNPAIWWAGIAAVLIAIVIAVCKKDKPMIVVFAAMAFQYLPWIGVPRVVFIYHFFSVVPFMILAIVYCIKTLLENYPQAKYIVIAYLAIVLVLFIMFYPVLSGLEVSKEYVDKCLLWFRGNWVF